MIRMNAQLDRFPYSNPHALGLHFITLGVKSVEMAPEIARGVTEVTNPPRPASRRLLPRGTVRREKGVVL